MQPSGLQTIYIGHRCRSLVDLETVILGKKFSGGAPVKPGRAGGLFLGPSTSNSPCDVSTSTKTTISNADLKLP